MNNQAGIYPPVQITAPTTLESLCTYRSPGRVRSAEPLYF